MSSGSVLRHSGTVESARWSRISGACGTGWSRVLARMNSEMPPSARRSLSIVERPFGALASALQGRAHPDRHEMRGFSTAQARAFPGFSAMSQPDSEAASDLIYEVEDGIGRVTFNRPQARNALTFAMYERLAQICGAADEDRSLKVLILTGQGDQAFAAGTDINQFRAFKTPQDALDYEAKLDRILSAVDACSG